MPYKTSHGFDFIGKQKKINTIREEIQSQNLLWPQVLDEQNVRYGGWRMETVNNIT